jgi:hypothetical protein
VSTSPLPGQGALVGVPEGPPDERFLYLSKKEDGAIKVVLEP